MNGNQIIMRSLAAIQRRLERAEARAGAVEQRLKQQQQIINMLNANLHAQPAVPGSPALFHDEFFVAKITGPDTAPGVFLAKRQVPTGLGVFKDDPTDTAAIKVKAPPTIGDGSGANDSPVLSTGAHVYVRWDGRNESTQYYHVVGTAGGASWLGIITSCATKRTAGTVTVKAADGNINSATAKAGAVDVTCQIKKEGWGRTGDPCVVWWVGGAVPWLAFVPTPGEDVFVEPTNLDGYQATPAVGNWCG